jgi:hypothetical protein
LRNRPSKTSVSTSSRPDFRSKAPTPPSSFAALKQRLSPHSLRVQRPERGDVCDRGVGIVRDYITRKGERAAAWDFRGNSQTAYAWRKR